MDQPFRLFLSHSSPSEASKKRVSDVARAIEAQLPNIQVLFDMEQIVGGDAWKARIAVMLHSCHAGVVLLDKPAVESKWVISECIVLSTRNLADPRFRFIPVFAGERRIIKDRMKKHAHEQRPGMTTWDVVDLPDIQDVAGATADLIASSIVDALRPTLGTQHGSLAERLADQIEPHLVQATGRRALDSLALLLEEASRYYNGNESYKASLGLVKLMMNTGRLSSVRQALSETRSLPSPQADEFIYNSLAPLLIPEVPAALLTRQGPREGIAKYSSIAVTATPKDLLPLYLRRGHLPNEAPRYTFLANVHGSLQGLVAELRELARAESKSLSIADLPDEVIDDLIRQNYRYVILPAADAAVLKGLGEIYPEITVVQYHRHSDPASTEIFEIAGVLTVKEEYAVLLEYLGTSI